MEFISRFDYIGPKAELYINKNTRFVSFTGGLFTILMGILSILAFMGFGYNLFSRQNPIAFISKELNEHPRINSTEPFFLFGPHLPLGFRLNENFNKKFMFKFRYINSDGVSDDRKNNLTFIIEYEMVPCTQTKKFKENYNNITNHLIIPQEDYYCIPDNMTIPIEYKFGTAKFGVYAIYFDFCEKISKDPSSCYSVEEIRRSYSKLSMHFIYLDSFIDPKDYNYPIKNIYNSDISLGNTNAQRQDCYFFRNLELYSDLGWIMESYQVENMFQYSYSTNIVVSPAVDPIFTYILSMDNIRDVYYRKYLKLQEVLANAGGFVKFCIMIIIFINDLLTRRTLLEHIYLTLIEKYEDKLQCNSNQVNILNIKSRILDPDIHNIHIPSKSNKISIWNSDHSKIAINQKKNLKLNSSNPFTKQKDMYQKLTCLDKICVCTSKYTNQNTLKILNFLDNDLKSTLNIDKMLWIKKLQNSKNKLLYGEDGHQLLKIIFLMNYLQFKQKEKSKVWNIEEMSRNFNLDCNKEDYGNYKLVLRDYINNNIKIQ